MYNRVFKVKRKIMSQLPNCPKCGSPLGDNMGEVSKCDHCGTITNKGDYDWVLAEITQMGDYLEEKIVEATSATCFLCSASVVSSPETMVAEVPIQITLRAAPDFILRISTDTSEPCRPR